MAAKSFLTTCSSSSAIIIELNVVKTLFTSEAEQHEVKWLPIDWKPYIIDPQIALSPIHAVVDSAVRGGGHGALMPTLA